MEVYTALPRAKDDLLQILFHQDLFARGVLDSHGIPADPEFHVILHFLAGALLSEAAKGLHYVDITLIRWSGTSNGTTMLWKDLATDKQSFVNTEATLKVTGLTFRALDTGQKWLVMISPEQNWSEFATQPL